MIVLEVNLWAGIAELPREHLIILGPFPFPPSFSCKEYRNALDELSKASLKSSSEEGLQPNRLHAGTTVDKVKT